MINQLTSLKALTVGVAFSLLAIGGCVSSPPSRLYTLHPIVFQNATESFATAHNKIIVVAPVEIPDYLDRPQMITRTSENQLSLAEFDLWGGSLKADIHRVLVEDLSRLLATDRFSVAAWRSGIPMDYKVTLHVSRFDAKPGEAVLLAAQWSLSAKEGKANVLIKSSTVTERIPTNDFAAVAAAMSRAVGRLSAEMAESIRSLP